MKPITFSEAERLVRAHGWVLHHIKGSHYIYRKAGEMGVVVIPHHPGNLPVGTQMSIMKTAGITREEL